MTGSTKDPSSNVEPPAQDGSADGQDTVTVPLPRTGSGEHTDSTNVQMATVLGRLWRTRGVLIYIIVVAAGLALTVFTVRQAVIVMGAPATGLTLGKAGLVRAVDERWPGIEYRDRIVEVNSQIAERPADATGLLLAAKPGLLTIRAARAGAEHSFRARTTHRTATERFFIGVRVLVGVLLLAMGAAAFLLRPGLRASWLGLLVAHAFGAFVLNEIALHDMYTVLAGRVQSVLIVLSAGLAIHFFAEFPRPVDWVRASPRRSAWFYLPSALVVAPFLATFPSLDHVTIWEASAVALRVWLALAALACGGLLWHQYRTAKRKADRRALPQCRAIFVGLMLGGVLPAGWNAIRLTSGVGVDTVHTHLNTAPLLILAGVTMYAFVRHNPLAVDRFTAAVVGYGATLTVLIAGFAAILVGLPLVVGQGSFLQSPPALVVLTVVVVLTFSPIYRSFKRRIDSWFFRDQVDLGHAVQLLQDLKRAGKDTNRESALQMALQTARALRTTSAQLWTLSDDGQALKLERGIGEMPDSAPRELSRGSMLVTAMAADRAARGVDGLAERLLDSTAQEQLWGLGMAAAAPVLAHGVFSGFLAIGRKRSGLAYTLEELSFLSAVAAEVASSLETGSAEGAQLGRYRIEKRIGTGGMAEVFLAWQLGPGGFERKVALKRPLPHLANDPECLAMLFDEARISAQLQHRHIVQIFEIDHRGGAYYIAMEHVDGPSLRRLLRAAHGRMDSVPLSVATRIAMAVLSALDHAHKQTDADGVPLGIVHRDVTPGNILLTERGEVKLTDFGIARAAVRIQSTQDGVAKGTLPYMSPEQSQGDALDHRSDLFSMAVVLFEMVTGKRPFPYGPTAQLPKDALDLSPAVPSGLRRCLERALEFDPDERFDSADEMRLVLLAALAPIEPASELELAAWSRSLTSLDR